MRDVTVNERGRSRNSIELEWKEPMFPNGQIKNYQIRYRTTTETAEHSKFHYQSAQLGTTQRTTVVNLDPGTEYVFEVGRTLSNGLKLFSYKTIFSCECKKVETNILGKIEFSVDLENTAEKTHIIRFSSSLKSK